MYSMKTLNVDAEWKLIYEGWQVFDWDADNPPNYGNQGYCKIQPGDTFKDGRFVAQKKLGWGVFATVWLAWDTRDSQYVALKVQSTAYDSTPQAQAEIDILQQVASKDQQNQRCVVKLLDHFIHRAGHHSHVCMVFEYLGDNLLKFIMRYAPKGLPLRLLKHICLHILDGLDFFHTEFNLIYGDMKPENICLVSTIDPSLDPLKPGSSPTLPPKQNSNDDEETSKIAEACTISLGQLVLSHDDVNSVESRKKGLLESVDHRCKLIDFGHVRVPGKGDYHSIQTMPYRSPEVILGDLPSFSTSADIWSFACVCFELATAQYLFPAEDGGEYCRDEDHLALMRQHLDRIPPAMIERGKLFTKKWFDSKGRLRNVPTRKRRTIKERLVEDCNFNEKDATELGDFLNWILKYEPTERPTAARCRRHKWFNDVKDDHHFISKTKLKNVNVVEDEAFSSKTKFKNVNVVENQDFSSKTKFKNVNVVENQDFISIRKLKNGNVVENEHFTCKSKENGGHKGKRERTKSKNENVSGSGRRKKAVMETTNAKAKRCRDGRLNPSKPF